eukprot:15446158-Alexandrium_andersonii.AAC.1
MCVALRETYTALRYTALRKAALRHPSIAALLACAAPLLRARSRTGTATSAQAPRATTRQPSTHICLQN